MKLFLYIIGLCITLQFISCNKENITAPAESKPSIKFISPSDNDVVLESVIVEMDVTAQPSIIRVVLSIDGLVDSTRTFYAPPYKYVWKTNTLPEGSNHELIAILYLQDGRVFSTGPCHVTVYHFTPSNLIAQMLSDTLISITWSDNSTKETSFELEGSINDGPFALWQQPSANTTTTLVSGRYSLGDSLSFRIRAVKDSITSNYSNIARVSIVFPAPSNLAILSLTDTDVQLSWQDNSNFESTFLIEHSTNGVAYSALAVVGKNATSATVSDTFRIDSTHYFRVRARSTFNTSSASNIASSIIGFHAPSGLTITNVSQDSLILRWTDNSSFENGFAIERQTSGGAWLEIQRVNSNTVTWIDASVDTANSYMYRIRAFTNINYSPYSATRSAQYAFDNTAILTIRPSDSNGYTTITSVVIPQDDKSVICAVGRAVRQYDITTGTLIRSFGSFATDIIGALAMSRDGSIIIARGCNDSTVLAWRVSDGTQILSYKDFTQTVYSIDLTPNGSYYAIPGGASQVLIRSTSNGALYRTITPPTNTNCIAFNNTGDYLAIESGIGYTALLYAVSNGSLVKTFSGHTSGIFSMAFNPSGTILATGSRDKTVKLWDMNGVLLRTLSVDNDYVDGVSFDPTGNFVAAGGLNRVVNIWRVSDGSVIRQLPGYTVSVTSTKFTQDGKLFLTGGYNSRIQIYKAYKEWISY